MYIVKIRHLSASIFAFFSLLSSVFSQGITFEEKLTWHQIIDKAKVERKYIFVDCYATWCGPCKRMEKEVYPSEKVAKFINDKFISIKLQMDTTKQDNELVRSRYALSTAFQHQYKVNSFPTYLFFSPDGKIVHKYIGYQNEQKFISVANNALDPNKQYYTLLENYKQGKKDYATMGKLAVLANYYEDADIASIIARDYINNYLATSKTADFFTKENVIFISSYLNPKEKYFEIFYQNKDRIDKIVGKKGFAQSAIDFSIYSEIIWPFLKETEKNNISPDWKEIKQMIIEKYKADDIDRNILLSKINWYQYKVDWHEYSQAASELVKRYEANLDPGALNSISWNIFLHIYDTSLLNIALNCSTRSIELSPAAYISNHMDTKANLLYKLGKVNEAITLEEKAISIANELKNERKLKELRDNIIKMKRGEPTWILPDK